MILTPPQVFRLASRASDAQGIAFSRADRDTVDKTKQTATMPFSADSISGVF